MAGELHSVSINMGAFTGATIHPLLYIPSTGGDITIVDAQVSGIAAGTSIGLILTTASDVGTPAVSGTIGAFAGTVVYAEGVVFECTLSSPRVSTGQWIAVDQTSGTCPASTWISLSYLMGR
jgi:hypothetical protein